MKEKEKMFRGLRGRKGSKLVMQVCLSGSKGEQRRQARSRCGTEGEFGFEHVGFEVSGVCGAQM